MRSGVFLFVLLLASSLRAADPAVFQPVTFDAERYRLIWERSPFVVETTAEQPSSPLAERYALTGITTLDGQPLVFLLDRKRLERISVAPGSNASGVELVSVVQNTDPKLARVNIRVGGEQGAVGYDLAALQGVNQPAGKPEVANQGPTAQNPASPSGPGQSPPPKRIIRRSAPINLAR